MNFLKDKLIISIFVALLLQIYIMSTRGDWTTRISQETAKSGSKYRFSLTKNLAIESEHFINTDNQIIGSATYIVTNKCFKIDSLSIKFYEVKSGTEVELTKTKTQLADINQIEFDPNGSIKEESLLKNEKIEICPGRQRIEITNWFKYTDKNVSHFRIKYFIGTDDNEDILGKAELKKKTRFEIHGRNHYDFIILLYPVLWILLGLLTFIKIIKSSTKK
jgi:hypothetical protein